MRATLSSALFLAFAVPASATSFSIELPGTAKVEKTTVAYKCAFGAMSVTYYNADGISLAVFDPGSGPVIASNVISGSGARYAGAQFIWWNKGPNGDLYDLTKGESAPPVSCTGA